ncbi:hypothetical protein Dsin_028546 [Dipteronia sinensis]|uniref:Myb/SANT-like domain-containing protein n=1 Tax=Dipteronia sinensis TaxID=43782 RepID=A0AAD9ZQS5_9ROSI|nr:hypothetical protein Dsin_028546 [Dipteronia sinensis]
MGKKTDKNDTNKRDRFLWTPQMDDHLIDALYTQHAQGNRVGGNFTSKAYENIVLELREKLGVDINRDKVKNRMKSLKTNFSECYDLFNKGGLSGFAWNPETKIWSAEHEVWENLLDRRAKTQPRNPGKGIRTAITFFFFNPNEVNGVKQSSSPSTSSRRQQALLAPQPSVKPSSRRHCLRPSVKQSSRRRRLRPSVTTFSEVVLREVWSIRDLKENRDFESEANLSAKKWRHTPSGNYEKLVDLFTKDSATGADAETAKEKRKRWDNGSGDNYETVEGIDQLLSQNEVT